MAKTKGIALFLRNKEHKNTTPEKKPFVPYEDKHPVTPLVYFLAVVPTGQEDYVQTLLFNSGAAIHFRKRGEGTATRGLYDVLGISDNSKRIVSSLIKRSTFLAIKDQLEAKFTTSPYSAGIAFTIPITGLYGLSAYKMLTDRRTLTTEVKKEDLPMDNSKFEVIFAIVNDGFSDLVMAAAKAAGARGGTILHARGTGNPDTEKFFGVVVTPEKEIVLIVVSKDIKDKVLSAIGKECGLSTKGQGICFSMPVEAVVGLSGGEEEKAASIEASEEHA